MPCSRDVSADQLVLDTGSGDRGGTTIVHSIPRRKNQKFQSAHIRKLQTPKPPDMRIARLAVLAKNHASPVLRSQRRLVPALAPSRPAGGGLMERARCGPLIPIGDQRQRITLPSASMTLTSPSLSARTGASIFFRSPTMTQVRESGLITSLAAASMSAFFCPCMRALSDCT